MKNINTLNTFPFKRWIATIGGLPTTFVESMSYYECLAWLTKFLEDTVIPAINENAEAVKEIQEWIATLDLQDEVDNKLDEMAESGQLTDLIAGYLELRGILAYNDLQEMKTATNINDGSFLRTYGRNTLGDGFGCYYKARTITNSDVVDNDNIVELHDPSLIAEKISSTVTRYPATVHYPYRVAHAGTCQVIEGKGFNAICDLGIEEGISALITYLTTHDITKIDYLIITHYDLDHIGGSTAEGLATLLARTDLDFTTCKFILPHHLIDWNSCTGTSSQKLAEETVIAMLTAGNYTIIYPTEGQEIVLDPENKFKFFNLSTTFFDGYYDNYIDESGANIGHTVYNNFAMPVKFTSCGHNFFFASDIIQQAETNIASLLGKVDVMTCPHHGVNQIVSHAFYENLSLGTLIVMDRDTVPIQRPDFAIYKDNLKAVYTSEHSGNITVNSADLYVKSDNGRMYPNTNPAIAAGDDLDDFVLEGTYHCQLTDSSSVTHAPVTLTNQFVLYVKQMNRGIILQVAFGIEGENGFWYRKKYETWKAWTKVNGESGKFISDGTVTTLDTSFATIPLESAINHIPSASVVSGQLVLTGTPADSIIEVTGQIGIDGGLTAGDRVSVIVNRNGNEIARTDRNVAGNYDTIPFHAYVFGTDGGTTTIGVQARNLTAARGTISDSGTQTFLVVKQL